MQYDSPMLLTVVFVACESMPSSGGVFSPVAVEPSTAAAPAVADTRFEPEAEVFTITSDELAKNATGSANGTGNGTAAAEGGDESADSDGASPSRVLAPSAMGVPSLSQFPVRLVSTIPNAQPPRAILGLPSGQEVVVAPGSMLATEGLVVMSISAGRVQLAKINAAGDHAQIDALEITAQYP